MPPDHGGPGSGYGSDADSREYLRKNARRRGQLLKQFTKLESGLGNSEAFRDGWVQAFGKHICGLCGERFEWASQARAHATAHLPFPALQPEDVIQFEITDPFSSRRDSREAPLAADAESDGSAFDFCTPSSDASTGQLSPEEDRGSGRSGCIP